MTKEDFLELREMLSIAHHVPGRLRIKFDLRILKHPAFELFMSLEEKYKDNGILKTRINPLARSLVLEYDPKRIKPLLWEDFFGSNDEEYVIELSQNIAKIFSVQLQ